MYIQLLENFFAALHSNCGLRAGLDRKGMICTALRAGVYD
jgi:hypothetical protein